jgi:thiol-disulfide isomerase/thioredoxin
MSKATRLRQQSAREKIAAQRAAARRAEIRRRAFITAGSVIVVIAIVVAFVVIKVSGNNNSSSNGSSTGVTGTVLPASVVKNITGVPASALNTVGLGSVLNYMATDEGGSPPLTPVSSTALTSNGKPEMLYIGAEFCPYCGAERWAMAVALSRFGTFTTPLRGFHSSPTDTDPNTPTLTFYKAKYSSPYLTFTPVENENINRDPLQNTTAAQQALWVKYDTTTTDGVSGTGYPFIDFGNKYVLKLPTYDPGVLAGMTWAQVAAALHDPSSAVAQGALGSANLMTAAICKMTGDKPGNVCTSAGVVKASGQL